MRENSRSRSAILHVLRKVDAGHRLADVERAAYPLLGWAAPPATPEPPPVTFKYEAANAGGDGETPCSARFAVSSADTAPATSHRFPSRPARAHERADVFSVLSAATPSEATGPAAASRPAPRTVTVWGPATPRVRRWCLNALPANKTYVDVKPSTAIESAVIGAHVAMRPLYARRFA